MFRREREASSRAYILASICACECVKDYGLSFSKHTFFACISSRGGQQSLLRLWCQGDFLVCMAARLVCKYVSLCVSVRVHHTGLKNLFSESPVRGTRTTLQERRKRNSSNKQTMLNGMTLLDLLTYAIHSHVRRLSALAREQCCQLYCLFFVGNHYLFKTGSSITLSTLTKNTQTHYSIVIINVRK